MRQYLLILALMTATGGCIHEPPDSTVDDASDTSSPIDHGTDGAVTDSGTDATIGRDVGDGGDGGTEAGNDQGTDLGADVSIGRVPGAMVLYQFDEGSGAVVRDRSGVSPPLDLEAKNPDALKWNDEGLTLLGEGTALRTTDSTAKIHDACVDSGALTVEAWITPASTEGDGPDRLLTYSEDYAAVNFMLGHGGQNLAPEYVFRLRTVDSRADGGPWAAAEPAATVVPSHVVFTFGGGTMRTYRDGHEVGLAFRDANQSHDGMLDWQTGYALSVGDVNQSDGAGRRWLGTLHLIAVYCRELTAEEVSTNFNVSY